MLLYVSQGMSTAVHAQPKEDFLKGEPHRKHPGVTNLKTLRLPEELQVAARSIIHSKLIYHVVCTSCSLMDPEMTQHCFATGLYLHL